jgi:hypothetical protein
MAPPPLRERLQKLGRRLRGAHPLVRLRALVLLGVGWLLSPLCWWNDLVINLPLAYGFARLVQHWLPDAFAAGLVVGYWLSNVVGILLMQSGALQILDDKDEEGDGTAEAPAHGSTRRDLLMGLATSSLYTVAVVVLARFGVLDGPLAGLLPEAGGTG